MKTLPFSMPITRAAMHMRSDGARVPPWRSNAKRSGGLAAWQAKLALEYIEEKLGSKMAIGDLADWVSLSKSHFSRAFKQSLGSPPMTYVVARRLERATLMMTSTREGLGAIAFACGFADQSHLSRYFRRAVGMSPGRWRRMSIVDPGCLSAGRVRTDALAMQHTSPRVHCMESRTQLRHE